METALLIATIAAHISTVLGIPLAILLFLNEKRKERHDREYGTYHALDDKYIMFLRLCLQHPELDLYSVPLGAPSSLSPTQKIQQYTMFEILISLMERSYLMYKDQSSELKRSQWHGWDSYIQGWCSDQRFRDLWTLVSIEEYDESFIEYLGKHLKLPSLETGRPA